ncbi:MAG: hypothetical protein K0Q70_2429, partial [Rhodospirillales bacterium]|nr:hypothetical protein [Rhodospirillales bacterium]
VFRVSLLNEYDYAGMTGIERANGHRPSGLLHLLIRP